MCVDRCGITLTVHNTARYESRYGDYSGMFCCGDFAPTTLGRYLISRRMGQPENVRQRAVAVRFSQPVSTGRPALEAHANRRDWEPGVA